LEKPGINVSARILVWAWKFVFTVLPKLKTDLNISKEVTKFVGVSNIVYGKTHPCSRNDLNTDHRA